MQRGSAWITRIFSFWLIALVALMVNWYTLLNGWSLEDEWRISSNPALESTQDAVALFADYRAPVLIGAERLYRPLTSLSLAMTRSAFGGSAFGFHFVDLSLAVMCSVWVFVILRRLLRRRLAAFYGAVLFSVLPIHTEAISSASWGRAELLSTWLLLIAWHLHLVFSRRRGRIAWVAAGAGVLFWLALLASETKWPFPVAVALADFLLICRARGVLFGRLVRRGAAVTYASLGVGLAAYAAMRLSILGEWNPLSGNYLLNPLQFEGPAARLFTGTYLIWKSFLQNFIPATLSHDYSWYSLPVYTDFGWGAALCLLVLAAWLAAIVFSFGRYRWLCFGLSFYLLNAAAVSNMAGAMPRMYAEHTFYWASFGAALLFGGGVKHAASRVVRLVPGLPLNRVVEACALTFLVCLSLITIMRHADWRNTSALVRADHPKYPANAALNLRMANLYSEAGQYGAAERLLLAGYAVHPGSHEIAANLSAGYLRTKDAERATEFARWAVRLAPRNPGYRAQLGVALTRAGNTSAALSELDRSASEFPSFAYTYFLRGVLKKSQGDYWAAEKDLARAVELDRSLEAAHIGLAEVRRHIRSLDMPAWLKDANPVQ